MKKHHLDQRRGGRDIFQVDILLNFLWSWESALCLDRVCTMEF